MSTAPVLFSNRSISGTTDIRKNAVLLVKIPSDTYTIIILELYQIYSVIKLKENKAFNRHENNPNKYFHMKSFLMSFHLRAVQIQKKTIIVIIVLDSMFHCNCNLPQLQDNL